SDDAAGRSYDLVADVGERPDAVADAADSHHLPRVVALPHRGRGSGDHHLDTPGPARSEPRSADPVGDAEWAVAAARRQAEAGEHRAAELSCVGAVRRAAPG